MTKAEQALRYFSSGCNCCQSVFAAFGPSYGLAESECLKIAAPFGAGVARAQEICGAVAGAVMAIGLARGADTATPDARAPVYEFTASFLEAFRARFGSLRCRDLLGIDLSTPEGIERLRAAGHGVCNEYVRGAGEILQTMLE